MIQFLAFLIPNRKFRHKFREKYKRKTKYIKLRDENIQLRQEVERLKAQCRSMRNEYKTLNYKYALPEQRPQMLKDWYLERTGQKLNLDNPRTFNEKIQWLKLYDNDNIKTRLADKFAVRDWVKEKIGEQYLIPLLGVYDTPEEIDWDGLPSEFVIKCNHGFAMNIIVKDKNKIDRDEVKRKLNKWLNTTFGFMGFQLQYINIPPIIIIEKKIENEGHDDLFDYKFYCFAGNPQYIQFSFDRFKGGLRVASYNTNWELQPFAYNHPMAEKSIERPDNLELMLNLAKKLSAGFKFVRVDFYRLEDGTIYFGEMTFTPDNGYGKWYGQDMGLKFGDLIKLS